MAARPKLEPLAFLCSPHGRYVRAGKDGTLIHVSTSIAAHCTGEQFTRIQRDEVSRAEVLAELAGEDGEP